MTEVKNLDVAKKIMLNILDEVVAICENHDINYWLDFGTLLGSVRHKGFIPWDDDIDISMTRQDYNKFLKIAPKELSSHYYVQHSNHNEKSAMYWTKVRHRESLYLEFGDKKLDIGKKGIFIDIFPVDSLEVKNLKRYNRLKKLYQINPNKILYKSKMSELIQKSLGFIQNFKPKIAHSIDEQLVNENANHLALGYEMWIYKDYPKNWIFPFSKGEFEGKFYNIPNDVHAILQKYYGDYMKLPKESERISHTDTIEIYHNPFED